MTTQSQVNSSILENHNRLQSMLNKDDKLANSLKIQDKLKMEEELTYYKVKEIRYYNP